MIIKRLQNVISSQRRYKPLEDMVNGEWDLTAVLAAGGFDRTPDLINRLLARLHESITSMATTSVMLSQVAPELANVASDLKCGAEAQAKRAAQIAADSRQMVSTVHEIADSTAAAAAFSTQVAKTAADLNENSKCLEEIVELISQIAMQTQIVSLNACVEAARAGEQGAAFGVVAGEMRALAGQTRDAASRVALMLTDVRGKIGQVATAIGESSVRTEETSDSADEPVKNDSLHALVQRIAVASKIQDDRARSVSDEVQEMAAIIAQDSAAAAHLAKLGRRVHTSCDELATTVGIFRLAAHRAARDAVARLARDPAIISMNKEAQETRMRRAIEENGFFELFYITNANGIQITSNIAPAGFQANYGSSGEGKDWSQRPWYLGAIEKNGIYISDVYRSVATEHFCFTVAAPLRGADGELLGVLGADVNFSDLLNID